WHSTQHSVGWHGVVYHAEVRRIAYGRAALSRTHQAIASRVSRPRVGNSRTAAWTKVRNRDTGMITLYSMQRSGNCYKVRLALAQLALEYNLVEIDIVKGETRTPEFLAKNPSGHVPLLEAAPGRYLSESGAILWYLAGGTPLVPEDRLERGE